MSRSDSTYPSDRPFVDEDGLTHLRGHSVPTSLLPAGAAITVAASDSGTVFVSDTAETIYTLPATQAGLTFTFVAGVVSVTNGVRLSPQAADKFIVAAKADDADLENTQATEIVGDSVTIVGNGSTGWVVTATRGIWA